MTDLSITQRLASFGIRHETGPHTRQFLYTEAGCIGLADVVEVGRLLDVLDTTQRRASALGGLAALDAMTALPGGDRG